VTLIKEYVKFLSPGTIMAETNIHEIEERNVDLAIELARSIKQRYNARPYGFRFVTRAREDHEMDSKIINTSHMYYLGGEIQTIEQVRKNNLSSERILLSNMECNNWDRIIINNNSWKWTQPLKKDDIVLDVVL